MCLKWTVIETGCEFNDKESAAYMDIFSHTFLFSVAIASVTLLSACEESNRDYLQGYVEGEFVYVSAESAGRIGTIFVKRGQQISAGDKLAALDDDIQQKQHEIVNKTLNSEISLLNNLEKGARQAELDILIAQISQAKQDAKIAKSKLTKYEKLREKGYVSDFELEQAQADNHLKQQRIAELSSQLKNKQQPSRSDEIAAQKAKMEASRLQVEKSQLEMRRRQIFSPVAAEVYDIIHHDGEVVSAGTPILSLLPPESVKIRFFVPHAKLARVSVGSLVRVKVDGAPSLIDAKVQFISPKAEYAPPVIFSSSQKERLVFMVEATTLQPQEPIRLGLPVEVML
ncbi:HlyD family efflux transporter periplasmic adaptor subunit [Paramixta manurensis]|uniref:HlyD family efflux transporter periplasmic adaptor subunit n=2 Tax=Paramixta manurensis TaxID=2740817 RepID=A0A6M8U977_9GAMM|nr:HlyD family efflux transporter periplasmic adaptor subunit [Erwiniaceae bacterium PD-1]